MNESLQIDNTEDVPETPEGKIAQLMGLKAKEKEAFVPPVGAEFQMGPFTFRVKVTNPSQLRFTAQLCDVNVEKKSRIVKPGRIIT